MTSSLIWTLFAAGPFFGVLPLGDSKTEDDLVVIYTLLETNNTNTFLAK